MTRRNGTRDYLRFCARDELEVDFVVRAAGFTAGRRAAALLAFAAGRAGAGAAARRAAGRRAATWPFERARGAAAAAGRAAAARGAGRGAAVRARGSAAARGFGSTATDCVTFPSSGWPVR